jgi:hypothetical protein
VRRDDVAVDALALLGKPFHELGTVDDFADCFLQRLALLPREDQAEILAMLQDQHVPTLEDRCAVLCGQCGPGLERVLRGLDRTIGIRAVGCGHARQFRSARRVEHGVLFARRGARRGGTPLAADQVEVAQQRLVVEVHSVPLFLQIRSCWVKADSCPGRPHQSSLMDAS